MSLTDLFSFFNDMLEEKETTIKSFTRDLVLWIRYGGLQRKGPNQVHLSSKCD